ncbi:hypothetical protein SLEP1_g27592 [Rubroshorea leprosula]|uniref:Uncharacterized protein n=1 Tax=Rubroshorea leprosula TaxID=152421 RepID=A0AAV5K096_9ROSI|nr:hypothetical protein SLEP1_g27592 [Rubroshorea leprosula]
MNFQICSALPPLCRRLLLGVSLGFLPRESPAEIAAGFSSLPAPVCLLEFWFLIVLSV